MNLSNSVGANLVGRTKIGYRILALLSLGLGLATRAETTDHNGQFRTTRHNNMQRLPPVYADPTLPTVEQLLSEIATQSIPIIKARLVEIVNRYRDQGVQLLQTTVRRMIDKNLSAREIAALTIVLELAMDEDARLAAQAATTNKPRGIGPWRALAETVAVKLAERTNRVPELQALKILTDQALEFISLSGPGKAEFRRTLDLYQEALALLGDNKIDGKGLERLFKANCSLMKATAREIGRDLCAAIEPTRAERNVESALLLGNSILNTDPTSKLVLREILARELETDRIAVNERGGIDWGRTVRNISTFHPNDARQVVIALEKNRILSHDDAQTLNGSIEHLQAARKTYEEIVRVHRLPPPQNNDELREHLAQVQQIAWSMNRRGQLGTEMVQSVTRLSSAWMATTTAQEASRMLIADINNPIAQRNLRRIKTNITDRLPDRLQTYR